MKYSQKVALKNGKEAWLRNGGFEEFGRNPLGFNSRITGFQEVVYMRLEL